MSTTCGGRERGAGARRAASDEEMKRIGVDTNVVVSFVTDRDPKQQARAAELFGTATSGEQVIVLHQAVITEAPLMISERTG